MTSQYGSTCQRMASLFIGSHSYAETTVAVMKAAVSRRRYGGGLQPQSEGPTVPASRTMTAAAPHQYNC